ncbi:MAG TPA: methyltransferase domain-containing protein [Myxococcota bacterium]|nr:methyltransferase domain-containing protein [Myxococcota bacterium]
MATQRPLSTRRRARGVGDAPVLFFRSFLERPMEVGSIIPSSRFLERRVARTAALRDARVVVELGPGTGGTTQALLRALRPDAHLLAIEINPRLAERVRKRLPDPRLVVHCGSAAEITDALVAHGLAAPEVVISGIPFSTMPRALALDILHSVRGALAPGGRFVAYQVRDRVAVLGREVFGPPSVALEVRNVPPMRVYRFDAGDGSGAGSPRLR